MPKLGIVADDLTGATTVGALLARVGIDTAVIFDTEAVAGLDPDHEAVILNSDSRPLPAAVARAAVARDTANLVAAGAIQFSKRIDTTCRGGIGPEVEGMLGELSDDHVAVVVPAMPQSRRIVVGGYSLIDSVLLARTAVAQDVRTPVHESHLPTLLAGQTDLGVGYVAIGDVIAGGEVLAGALRRERDAGARMIMVDATSIEDVDAIAAAVVGLGWDVVCVDPGPFTERVALQRGIVTQGELPQRTLRLEAKESDEGTVLVVAGSAMKVTTVQINELRKVAGTQTIQVPISELVLSDDRYAAEMDRVAAETQRLLDAGGPRVLVLALQSTITGEMIDLPAMEVEAGMQPGHGASLVSQRLGALGRKVADLLGDRLAGVYLTGGDVMVNTCFALGASGIKLVDYVIPQIDQGVLVGGPSAGVPVVCKGGMTGNEVTAVQAINRIFDER